MADPGTKTSTGRHGTSSMDIYGWCTAEDAYVSEHKKGFRNWHAPKPHLVKKNEKDVGTFHVGETPMFMTPAEERRRVRTRGGEGRVDQLTLTADAGALAVASTASFGKQQTAHAVNIFECDGVHRYTSAYAKQNRHPLPGDARSQAGRRAAGGGPQTAARANIISWGTPLSSAPSSFEAPDAPSLMRSGQLHDRNLQATGAVHALPRNVIGGPADPTLTRRRGARNVYADI